MGGVAIFFLLPLVSEENRQRRMGPVLQKLSLNSNCVNVEFSKLAKNRCGQNLWFLF